MALCGNDEELKGRVQRLLDGEIEELSLAVHAGPGRGNKKTDDATIGLQSNSAEYVIARLNLDLA